MYIQHILVYTTIPSPTLNQHNSPMSELCHSMQFLCIRGLEHSHKYIINEIIYHVGNNNSHPIPKFKKTKFHLKTLPKLLN